MRRSRRGGRQEAAPCWRLSPLPLVPVSNQQKWTSAALMAFGWRSDGVLSLQLGPYLVPQFMDSGYQLTDSGQRVVFLGLNSFNLFQPITTGGVNYRDQPWHKECFVCIGCKGQLAGQRFTSRDDFVYCLNCFCNLFAKKCASCTCPISGKVNLARTVSEGGRVFALALISCEDGSRIDRF